MAANRSIAAAHEVGPSQFVLHFLVAFLDRDPQAIKLGDFGERCLVAAQIPGGLLRQGAWVRGGVDGAD